MGSSEEQQKKPSGQLKKFHKERGKLTEGNQTVFPPKGMQSMRVNRKVPNSKKNNSSSVISANNQITWPSVADSQQCPSIANQRE
ncbi:hypothetical protein HPB50_029310 [Hyalomma asiaticum]|nr:hypothetical protein HPB50_029310 [Hyalomma asiaticum]